MLKVPLWLAILIETMLFFIAISEDPVGYTINREAIWVMIGINFLFIIIPILKRNSENIETNNAIQNLQIKQDLKKLIEDNDPEAMFDVAIYNLHNNPTEEDKQASLTLIVYASECGCQRATEFLETITKNK